MRIVALIVFLSCFMAMGSSTLKAQLSSDHMRFDISLELSQCSPQFFEALLEIRDVPNYQLDWKTRILIAGLEELEERKENTRLVATILTMTLGPFGAHRLYLGTEAVVPIFYTLTLGGGLGILPVVDLFHILLTKDLSRYYNNGRVLMWGGESQEKVENNPERNDSEGTEERF